MTFLKTIKISIATLLIFMMLIVPFGGAFAADVSPSPEQNFSAAMNDNNPDEDSTALETEVPNAGTSEDSSILPDDNDTSETLEDSSGNQSEELESKPADDSDTVLSKDEDMSLGTLSEDEEIQALAALVEDMDTEPEHDGYIVILKESATEGKKTAEAAGRLLSDEYIVVEEPEDVLEFVSTEDIDFIMPDYVGSASDSADFPPNDPEYVNQANLKGSYGLLPEKLWRVGLNGANVKVAVLDTGINRNHQDFNSANIHQGYNFHNGDGNLVNNNTADDNRHGTHITSTIAAQPNNNKNIVGVAYKSIIVPYKVLGSDGKGSVSGIRAALDHIADYSTADVINMSLSYSGDFASLKAYLQPTIDRLVAKGVIVIAAVGNGIDTNGDGYADDFTSLSFPASCDNVIGVGNIRDNGTLHSSSQRNASVDVVAPGENIVGLTHNSNTGTISLNGTSCSAPLVASLAAIAKTKDSKINTSAFMTILSTSVDDLGAYGRDDMYGMGAIDTDKFLSRYSFSGWVSYTDGQHYFIPSTKFPPKGFYEVPSTGMYYFPPESFGAYVKGVQKIESNYYYFGTDGIKKTGLYENMYFSPSTGYAVSGWQTIGGKQYYFLPSTFKMAQGAVTIGKDTYLFNKGQLFRGWLNSGGWYHSNSSGILTVGWFKDGGSWCFLDKITGKMATGWNKIDGYWYFFDKSNGKMATGWNKIDGSWYFFNGGDSGRMLTGWQKINGSWYYFYGGDNGRMATGWNKLNGSWYYFFGGDSGRMATGWQKISGYWYYFFGGDSGRMATGWYYFGDSWYYFYEGDNGRMATGWIEFIYYDETEYHYFFEGDDGRMATGWHKIEGDWYYFLEDGDGRLAWW